MLTVCTLLWQPNAASRSFSTMYDEGWVEKLHRGFRRNLTIPFRFICFTDRRRKFAEPDIEQERIRAESPDYSTCIEPYRLGVPMVLVGLDTVVVGNCDKLAEYCLSASRPAFPVDPYRPQQVCNGVGLVPAGWQIVATSHRGENDMEWVRSFPHERIDSLFPGQVQSYKGAVKKRGLGDTRICFFHGQEKPYQLSHVQFVQEHWI